MYLDTTAQHNPGLIRTAVALHQAGVLPANTYLIDLDIVRHNAAVMAAEAKRTGIALYFMSKHFNRNPVVANAIVAAGIPSAVAVDVQCARSLHRYGVPVGHVGHLVQVPKHDLPAIVAMHPDVVTLFSLAKAEQLSEAASAAGVVQPVLVRVRAKNDVIYPNEEGGIWEDELDGVARGISRLPGLRLVGITTFPATGFSPTSMRMEPAVNFATLQRAADHLRQSGYDITQVNAPGASCTAGFEMVAKNGGTHAEPGHALLGTTPAALYGVSPERPAMVYVNEVSHLFEKKAYVFGGGFYACDTTANRGDDSMYHGDPWVCRAFVGREAGAIFDTKVPVDIGSFFGRTLNATDYYGGTLCPEEPADIRVGDTVVYGFRAQAFTTRAQVAVVENVNSIPRLLGVFDRANNLLDESGYPIEGSVRAVTELAASMSV